MGDSNSSRSSIEAIENDLTSTFLILMRILVCDWASLPSQGGSVKEAGSHEPINEHTRCCRRSSYPNWKKCMEKISGLGFWQKPHFLAGEILPNPTTTSFLGRLPTPSFGQRKMTHIGVHDGS